MTTEKRVYGEIIHLRGLRLEDCSQTYVEWLNDPDVNQYLEVKWSKQTLESIRQFVEEQRRSKDSILFAIIENTTKRHIGNMKLGPIHAHYRHGDISYFIGEKSCWNKGMATEAIRLICQFGFEELGLNRIEAGAYELAAGSWRALEKNHFKREGRFRQQICFNRKYIDVFRYGLLKSEWYQNKESQEGVK